MSKPLNEQALPRAQEEAALALVPANVAAGLIHAVRPDVLGRRHPACAAGGMRGLDPEEHPDLREVTGHPDRVAMGDDTVFGAAGARQLLSGGGVQVVVT